MFNKDYIKKTFASVLIILTVLISYPLDSLAVNEQFDDPNDNLVSQNEQFLDLLNEEQPDKPKVSASAYVLIDADSGDIICGNEYDRQMQPASTTKVMTVLLALQELDMEETVTVTPAMAEKINAIPPDYVKMNLQEGEVIPVKDLVYAAVLKSANDACLVLGMHISGTEEQFCQLMTSKAKEIGCKNTHFTSSFGFADPENLLTAYDLCLILKEAITTTNYSEIATTYSYTIPATNMWNESRSYTNANRFVSTKEYSYEPYIGGKTGFTDTAGHTLVAAARKNDRTLVGCVLNEPDGAVRYSDLIHLFEYGFSNYVTIPVTRTEYVALITSTTTYIEDLLTDTNLYISDSKTTFSDFLTTTSARAQAGSTNKAELTKQVIDVSKKKQTLDIPLVKSYADGKNYIIGSMILQIEEKARTIEVNPKKPGGWSSVRNILIVTAGISFLILILVGALLIFRHKIRKRRYNDENKPSRML